MAKEQADLTLDGHRNGDSDGLGCFRGIRIALFVEGIAIVLFALALHTFWKP